MKFDICLMLTGVASKVIEAESQEEAERIAKEKLYGSDWNDLACVDIEVTDCEEVSG